MRTLEPAAPRNGGCTSVSMKLLEPGMVASASGDRDDDHEFEPPAGATSLRGPGEVLVLDGDGSTLLHVRSGRVLASIVGEHGEELLSLLRGPGDLIGIERLANHCMPYEIWPLSDAVIETLSVAQLRAWAERSPANAAALYAKGIDAACRCIVERAANRGATTTRVARFLLEAADGEEGAPMLHLPRNIIARILQMRAETLSRTLHRFADQGLIELRPALALRDRAGLARVGGRSRRVR